MAAADGSVENKDAAKIATPVAEPRAMAIGLGVYEREVGFYRDLSVKAGARVPHSYFAEVLPDGRFALVLEDFPEAVAGDQMKSCTVEEAYLAVGELAKLHAKWWDSPELVGYSWLPAPGHAFFDIGREAYRQSLSVFRDIVVGMANINPEAYGERGGELVDLLFGSMAEAILEYDAERWLP